MTILGMASCKPAEVKPPYGVFLLGDVDALKAERTRYARRVHELVRENALLCQELDKIRREKAFHDND